jgi:DNA topoisomerase-3
VVSYGPCQFPTLGFVVSRCLKIDEFEPEEYWYVSLKLPKKRNGKIEEVEFTWCWGKLFDKYMAGFYYQDMLHNSQDEEGVHKAKIVNVQRNQVKKFKPYPLTTETMTKIATKKLRLGAKQIMKIAEKLYTDGYISYPRTETNKYNKTINLESIVGKFKDHRDYGAYASELLDN